MAVDFVMPKLGLTMEEGTIVEWLAATGTTVSAGQSVLSIETDKVETEVAAPGDGVLHCLGAPGDTFACGEVIALLLTDGEAVPTPRETVPAQGSPTPSAPPADRPVAVADIAPPAVSATGRLLASPNARRVAAERGVALRAVRGTGPGGRVVSEDVVAFSDATPAPSTTTPGSQSASARSPEPGVTPPATIAARQLADLLGVDLRLVAPAAADGRRSREDVAAYVRRVLTAAADAPPGNSRTPSPGPPAPLFQQPTEIVPLTGMRGTIAQRMHASLKEMAQLTLHVDARMDAVVADRTARAERGAAPGYTDYVVAAIARSLRDHPMLNSQVVDSGIAVLPDIHVGLAVAVEGGLLVPVVRHADRLDLSTLASETTRLAERAKSKRLSLDEMEGGTFAVTALGMYGVDGFTPVINSPNAAILGVGRLRDVVEVIDGAVSVGKVLTLSLTWDHRVLDGAPAAAFAAQVAVLLADPAALDRVL